MHGAIAMQEVEQCMEQLPRKPVVTIHVGDAGAVTEKQSDTDKLPSVIARNEVTRQSVGLMAQPQAI